MKSLKNSNYIQRLGHLCQKYIETIDETERQSVRDKIQSLTCQLSYGLFRIVVMGEVKKGKTSFIQALLGAYDILPIESNVATSTVYKLMYGPKDAYNVYFLPENGNGKEKHYAKPLPITRQQISEYGTEKSNADNRKKVDFLGIEIPNPILKQGIVIVDTPGLGGLYKRHKEITYNYVPRADAVFFVLDSVDSVINSDEIKFLKDLYKHTKNLFFIQTKIDAVGTKQCDACQKRNLDILSEQLDLSRDKIPYFAVSSKNKQSADKIDGQSTNSAFEEKWELAVDSGFIPIINYLNKCVIPNKNHYIAKEAAKFLSPEIAIKGKQLQDCLRITCEENEDRLKKVENEMKTILAEVEKWRAEGLQKEIKKFQCDMANLKRSVLKENRETFHPIEKEFNEMMARQRIRLKNAREVSKEEENIITEYADYCSTKAQETINRYQEQFKKLFEKTLRKSKKELDALITEKVEIDHYRSSKVDAGILDLEAIRTGVITGSLAGGVVGQILVTVGILASGPAGWAFAATTTAAAILAGAYGYMKAARRNLENALAHLQTSLAQIAQRSFAAVEGSINDLDAQMVRQANESFQKMADETQKELKIRLNEIQKARKRTRMEARQAVAQIMPKLKQMKNLDGELKRITENLQGAMA
jgi:hypothetical protein